MSTVHSSRLRRSLREFKVACPICKEPIGELCNFGMGKRTGRYAAAIFHHARRVLADQTIPWVNVYLKGLSSPRKKKKYVSTVVAGMRSSCAAGKHGKCTSRHCICDCHKVNFWRGEGKKEG